MTTADVGKLIAKMKFAIESAVFDLDCEHYPFWASDQAKADGKKAIGCVLCYPGDSHWPCTSKMVADELRAVLE